MPMTSDDWNAVSDGAALREPRIVPGRIEVVTLVVMEFTLA